MSKLYFRICTFVC